MIQLRRGLIEPGAPRPAPIQGHHGPLVTHQGEGVGIRGADPDVLVVVTAGRAPQRRPGLSTINRSHRHESGAVHNIGIGRIHSYDWQITTANVQGRAWVRGDTRPTRASIVGAEYTQSGS